MRGTQAPAVACIEADELVAMVEGTLPPERSDVVLQHIDSCHECADVVAALGSLDGPPDRVGRYRLEAVLGAGAMGIVHRGWDPELRRHVAIKVVRPERANPESHARMLREARSLARIAHPNVVAVHDVGEYAGGVYLATEFVDGPTLDLWLDGKGDREILDAWIQVGRGIAAAHAEEVLHRDVKPSNILVGRDGRVRIGDFGLARWDSTPKPEKPSEGDRTNRHVDRTIAETVGPAIRRGSRPQVDRPPDVMLTAPGALAGTPAYMAPEQWEGEFDARADQFAICVGIVESLTSQRPAAGATVVLTGAWNPAQRAGLETALTRGLARDRDQRFPRVDDLVTALIAARDATPRRRRAGLWLVTGAGALAIGATTGLALITSRRTGECAVPTFGESVWPAGYRAKFTRYAHSVDRLVAAWNTTANDMCSVTTDDIVRSRRALCLAHIENQLGELLARWDRTLPSDPIAANRELDTITQPARCSHSVVVAAPLATPAQQLASVAIGILVDDADDASGVAKWVEPARRLGYPPLDARVAIALANQQEPTIARRTLRDALALALDDASIAAVTSALIANLGADPNDEAPRLADAARIRLARSGDVRREAELDEAVGGLAVAKGRISDAIAAYDRARRNYHLADGPDGLSEAGVLLSLGMAYRDQPAYVQQGTALHDEGRAIFHRHGIEIPPAGVLGAPSDELASALEFLKIAESQDSPEGLLHAVQRVADVHLIGGRLEDALAAYRRVIEIAHRNHLEDEKVVIAHTHAANILVRQHHVRDAIDELHVAIDLARAQHYQEAEAAALSQLGGALVADGQTANAVAPLREALALIETLKLSAQTRGTARFLLARALQPTDAKRARETAITARQDLETALATLPEGDQDADIRELLNKRVADIDHWLAKN